MWVLSIDTEIVFCAGQIDFTELCYSRLYEMNPMIPLSQRSFCGDRATCLVRTFSATNLLSCA